MAKEGKKVLVVDKLSRYGGVYNSTVDPLSLTQIYPTNIDNDFQTELESKPHFNKSFLIDISPVVLSVSGPLCQKLLDAEVSKYLEFRPISKIAVISDRGETIFIPMSKEDIFMDQSLSLVEKRQLSKLINMSLEPSDNAFAESIAGFSSKIRAAINYGVLLCGSPREAENLSVAESISRLQNLKEGLGRYGAGTSPFLYPIYGSSEISQAYYRQCAVNGGTFIMGQPYEITGNFISGSFDGNNWTATFDHDSQDEMQGEMINRVVYIADGPFGSDPNSCIWIIQTEEHIIFVLNTGSDSSCAPVHHFVIHAWSATADSFFIHDTLSTHMNLPDSAMSPGKPSVLFSSSFIGPRPVLGSHTE